jgi:hypothetical protein
VKDKEEALDRVSELERELEDAKKEIARLRCFMTEEEQRLIKGY